MLEHNDNLHLGIEITRRCLLTCQHCCVSASPNLKKSISDETLSSILKWLSSNKVESITFTGGEPLLEIDRIDEFLKQVDFDKSCPSRNIKIVTGCGVDLKGYDIGYLKNVFEKINRFIISIDSYHTKLITIERYKNYFDLLSKLGKQVSVSLSYNGPHDIIETYKLLSEDLQYDGKISYQPILSLGRARDIKSEEFFSDKIPNHYRCPMLDWLFVRHDGKVSFCCVFNKELLFDRIHSKITNKIEDSNFYKLLASNSLKKLSSLYKIDPPYDIKSKCLICHSVQKKILEGGSLI